MAFDLVDAQAHELCLQTALPRRLLVAWAGGPKHWRGGCALTSGLQGPGSVEHGVGRAPVPHPLEVPHALALLQAPREPWWPGMGRESFIGFLPDG